MCMYVWDLSNLSQDYNLIMLHSNFQLTLIASNLPSRPPMNPFNHQYTHLATSVPSRMKQQLFH